MTDHTFAGLDRDADQRARNDGLVDFRGQGPDRLGSSDDEEPEHDTIILAW
jgi:hypothetical protein